MFYLVASTIALPDPPCSNDARPKVHMICIDIQRYLNVLVSVKLDVLDGPYFK